MGLRLAGQLDLSGQLSGTPSDTRTVVFALALVGSLIPKRSAPRTDATLAYARTTTLSVPARTTTLSLPTRTTAVI